jgi:MoCo/4Fe-4S cofactor protein with predicted Tat translocation signal
VKNVVQHPEVERLPNGGKAYWRSLEDYADSEDFHLWLDREFPAGASEFWGDGVSRRNFLKLMGASMALAGFGMASCRRPEAYIVPFVNTPEWQIPGRFLPYATAMPRRNGAIPLLVQSFSGRPVKTEGNPIHPLSQGKSDTYAQASLLDLYDPDRSSRYVCDKKTSSRAAFVQAFDEAMASWRMNSGRGLAIVSEANFSPTTRRLRRDFEQLYPAARWVTYEPADAGYVAEATAKLIGPDLKLKLNADQAEVFFSLDNDFLSSEHGELSAIRGFSEGRRVKKASDSMNRLYVLEPRYTETGGMADHRQPVKSSEIPLAVVELARRVAKVTGDATLQAMVGDLPQDLPADLDKKWIIEAARDLEAHHGKAVVLVGEHHPVAVQALALAINQALGAIGTILEPVPWVSQQGTSLSELSKAVENGEVSSLIILGGNPVYNSPATIDFTALLAKASLSIRLGSHEDETSAHCQWHVPQAHYLESWGDDLDACGQPLYRQPLILPLFDGLTVDQLLSRMTGEVPGIIAVKGEGEAGSPIEPFYTGPQLVQKTFSLSTGLAGNTSEFRERWTRTVREGFDSEAGKITLPATFKSGEATALVKEAKPEFKPAAHDGLEVLFAVDASLDDGRYANNGWLMEAPDPITKLTWDNAVLISPATAEVLGIEAQKLSKGVYHGQIIKLTVEGFSIEAPLHVVPGFAKGTLVLPLGYGRELAGRVGNGVGFNAYTIKPGADRFYSTYVKVEPTGKFYDFAVTQEHWSMEGRGIVRQAPIDYYRKYEKKYPGYKYNFANKQGMESHTPPNRSLYQTPYDEARQALERGEEVDESVYSTVHQWAMTIDLTTCTGCSACVVACQAENNIPIVGKDQVKKGREMHWMRIDRYFTGLTSDNKDISKFRSDNNKEIIPNAPEMITQPLLCMQCENAPCETVCPVNATVHTNEGLNAMAYNRCIGTRYCANNCPYKVRRFNWFDYNQRQLDQLYISGRVREQGWVETLKRPLGPKGTEELTKMSKNPNVTVRMRGVIEKCTFCVQRLEEAKIDHKAKPENRTTGNLMIPTDSVQTACQQVCPTDSIIFGNLKDEKSRVVEARQRRNGYKLLDYLNTQPRVTYLAKLRNPNPAMPGAAEVAMSLIASKAHHSDEGHDDHDKDNHHHNGHSHDHPHDHAQGGGH